MASMTSNPELDAFLAAIAAAPLDSGLVLIFADWLEEQGHPLAKRVRLMGMQPVKAAAIRGQKIEPEKCGAIRAQAIWLLFHSPSIREWVTTDYTDASLLNIYFAGFEYGEEREEELLKRVRGYLRVMPQ